jgi:hypothetical protein
MIRSLRKGADGLVNCSGVLSAFRGEQDPLNTFVGEEVR